MSNSFQCEIRARPLLLSYKPMSKLTRPILAGSLAALATLAIPFLASSSATRPHRQLSYIVQFHPDHNLQAGIAAVQKTAHASLYRELPIISGASFTMDPGQLDAVRALPDRCRQVIMLRYLDGLAYKEIAEQLGISPETVKVHMAKGMRRCAAFFADRGLLETAPSSAKEPVT